MFCPTEQLLKLLCVPSLIRGLEYNLRADTDIGAVTQWMPTIPVTVTVPATHLFALDICDMVIGTLTSPLILLMLQFDTLVEEC